VAQPAVDAADAVSKTNPIICRTAANRQVSPPFFFAWTIAFPTYSRVVTQFELTADSVIPKRFTARDLLLVLLFLPQKCATTNPDFCSLRKLLLIEFRL
jgi:hypothetical protein